MIITPNFLTTVIHKTNYILDALINDTLDHEEIVNVTYNTDYTKYHITITFSDGSVLYGWNQNKWYAWLHKGTFKDYTWDASIPKAKTMRRLRKRLVEYAKKPHDIVTYRQFK